MRNRVSAQLVIGDTWRPPEHPPIPVALRERACLAGGRRVALPDCADAIGESAPRRGALPDDEPWFERVTHPVALDAGRAAVVATGDLRGEREASPASAQRVVVLDACGATLAEAALSAPVTALTAVGTTLVAGCADGRLVRLDLEP